MYPSAVAIEDELLLCLKLKTKLQFFLCFPLSNDEKQNNNKKLKITKIAN